MFSSVSIRFRQRYRQFRLLDAENERSIEEWNTHWMIVAGRAVSTSCIENQALEDCESPFLHADNCPASDVEGHHPWAALHDILDSARG